MGRRRSRRGLSNQVQHVNVSVNVTYRCNARCFGCDRLCDQLDVVDSDIQVEHLEKLAADLAKFQRGGRGIPTRYHCWMLRITGGQPTVHHDLPGVMQFVQERLVNAGLTRRARLVTNGTQPAELLPNWSAYCVGLQHKRHIPFGLSPADIGMAPKEPIQSCAIQNNCGICYDYQGWAFCHIAPQLGRVLGIDAHQSGPTVQRDKRICDHCIFCLEWPRPTVLQELVTAGALPCPSRTIAAGIERDPAARPSALRMLGDVAQEVFR